MEYICGPVINAENKQQAIESVMPVYKLSEELASADILVCIPRNSIGISFVVGMFLATMGFFSILGFIVGSSDEKYRHKLRGNYINEDRDY